MLALVESMEESVNFLWECCKVTAGNSSARHFRSFVVSRLWVVLRHKFANQINTIITHIQLSVYQKFVVANTKYRRVGQGFGKFRYLFLCDPARLAIVLTNGYTGALQLRAPYYTLLEALL